MPQAIAMQTQVPSDGVSVSSGIPPGAAADASPFAQLLMAFGQVANSGGAERMPFAPIDVLPPPAEKTQLTAHETEQVAAMWGLPVYAFSPLPTPPNQPAMTLDAMPVMPPQAEALPEVVTDSHTPLVPAQAQALPGALPQQMATPTGSAAGSEVASEPRDQQASPVQPVDIPSSEGGASNLHRIPSIDTLDRMGLSPVTAHQVAESDMPAPQIPPANNADTTRFVSQNATTVQNMAGSGGHSAQACDVAQFQANTRHEEQHTPAEQVAVRVQPKKPRLTPAERPTPIRAMSTVSEGVHGGDFASVVHRTSVGTASPVVEVSPGEVIRQVVNRIETMIHQPRTHSVTLQLEPEHLGKLRVTISVSDGTIHTHIVADNHAVRQMLESNSAWLQQALQERGLQLGALQVSVQGDGRQFHLNQPYTPQRPTGGWAQVGAATVPEVSFGYTTAGGINLLV